MRVNWRAKLLKRFTLLCSAKEQIALSFSLSDRQQEKLVQFQEQDVETKRLTSSPRLIEANLHATNAWHSLIAAPTIKLLASTDERTGNGSGRLHDRVRQTLRQACPRRKLLLLCDHDDDDDDFDDDCRHNNVVVGEKIDLPKRFRLEALWIASEDPYGPRFMRISCKLWGLSLGKAPVLA